MKRRKKVLLGSVLILAFLASAVGILFLLIRHEPAFYRRAAVPPGKDRKQNSNRFLSKCIKLIQGIQTSRPDEPIEVTFRADEVNSYLDEDLGKKGIILPDNISEPRVEFDDGIVRVAFRYGKKPWSTVISIDLKVWHKEPNIVAMELQRVRAGLLPIAPQSFLEDLSESARQQNIELTWYRRGGNPVALLRFQADEPTPTIWLQRLELRTGTMIIRGCSTETGNWSPAGPVAIQSASN
ncbi:MAG: hypothetical protein KatS3mg105_2001 [Gemmatales bacterium]|nr:MAG: hypothetical protein KatS3mg105_2001 [Gemmatales bacterium]